MAEIILLNRIRVDIGNVSGSITELLQYAGMAGFNDDYGTQPKPRLVGTWTINDWYTVDQLEEAKSKFDMADPEHEHTGLTIIEDPTHAIDFDELAVQTLDNTQPNYNPAVAIVLQAAGYGNTLNSPIFVGQTGRWFLTKEEAATRNIGLNFVRVTTKTDTNGIVSADTTKTYDFEYFEEFQYFTSITSLNYVFSYCFKLKSVNLPDSVTSISGSVNGEGVCDHCKSLISVHIPENLVSAKQFCFNNLKGAPSSLVLVFPASLTQLLIHAASESPNIKYVRFLGQTPPTVDNTTFTDTSYKIYVGEGESQTDDNAIKDAYLAGTGWSTYSSRLDTWYNYLHPTT